jgi:hypothetical protein
MTRDERKSRTRQSRVFCTSAQNPLIANVGFESEMKRSLYIAASVSAIAVILLVTLRRTGLPDALTELPLVGDVLQNTFGHYETRWHTNRVVSARQLIRGRYRPLAPGLSIMSAPTVRGDYYDLHGKLISSVRDGRGMRTLFHSNGTISQLASFDNGFGGARVFINWTQNGQLKSCKIGGKETNPTSPSTRTQ